MLSPLLYVLLNLLCHILHVGLIVFVALGWLFAPLQAAHLGLVLAMLGCWFILGHWLGAGYCPITDAHWRVKAALGPGRPANSYIHYVLAKLGQPLDPARLDRTVGLATLGIALASVVVNVPRVAGLLR